MIAAAKKSGENPYGLDIFERFNPASNKAQRDYRILGTLGKIVSISNQTSLDPNNPRIRNVGVILDIGVP